MDHQHKEGGGITFAVGAILVIALLVVVGGSAAKKAQQVTEYEDSLSGDAASQEACTASSSRVVIGNQSSTQLLASSSNRMYAKVQQPDVATNTVYIRAQSGVATALNGTNMLEKSSATGTDKIFEFGKATWFPYVGPVSAITDVGSTTVLVTECSYMPNI